MALWNFVQKRMQMLGLTFRQIEDEFEIAYATMQRIRQNKPIKDSTKQKLALALSCSMGDINAAIANLDGPEPEGKNNKESEASVMEAVNKLEQMVETEYPELDAPADPKPCKVKAKEGAAPGIYMQRAAEDKKWPKESEAETEMKKPSEKKLIVRDTQKTLNYHLSTNMHGECDIYVTVSTYLPPEKILQVLAEATEEIAQELRGIRQWEV